MQKDQTRKGNSAFQCSTLFLNGSNKVVSFIRTSDKSVSHLVVRLDKDVPYLVVSPDKGVSFIWLCSCPPPTLRTPLISIPPAGHCHDNDGAGDDVDEDVEVVHHQDHGQYPSHKLSFVSSRHRHRPSCLFSSFH